MPDRKNVLFILTDEFRPECLNGSWAGQVSTPNLDALAWEGVLFDRCYCQASPCAPSRMSIHTGRYMCSTGAIDNMTPLVDPEDNLGAWLRRHGMDPGIAGYNDYAIDPGTLPEGHPHRTSLCYDYFLPGYRIVLDHEFDSPEWYDYLRERGYAADWCNREVMYEPAVPAEGPCPHLPCHYPARYRAEDSEANFLTSKAIGFAKENQKDGWFINLNYIKPHPPYISPAPYHDMYLPESMPEPVRKETESTDPLPYFARMKSGSAKTQFLAETEWRETRACYFGMVTEIDACVGRLIDFLKETGQWESTLIVFGADHGTYLGDHFLYGKPHFYEQAMRVPLIVRDPRQEANSTRGSRVSGIVENVDIVPTVCDFLGVPRLPRCQGTSLMPLLHSDENASAKTAAYFEFYYYNYLQDGTGINPAECRLWVRIGERFKYVIFGEKEMYPLLFDLQGDPGEFHNLAVRTEYSEFCRQSCEELIRWRIRNEDMRMEDWARPYR